jgi:hypothetical protein
MVNGNTNMSNNIPLNNVITPKTQGNVAFPKDNIQEIINQTVSKKLNIITPKNSFEVFKGRKGTDGYQIDTNYAENIKTPKTNSFSNQNKSSRNEVMNDDSCDTKSSNKSNNLKVVIKLTENVEKVIELNEKEDTHLVVKRFCADNALKEDLVLPILSKIYLSLDYFNEINNYELNEEIETVFKEAFELYNDSDKVESLLKGELAANSFNNTSCFTLEEKRKRGCSV